MNPTTNQQVFSEPEDYQSSFVSQDNGIPHSPIPEQVAENILSNDVTYYVQSCIPSQQEVIIQPVHPTIFFYQPPNDFCHYHVRCEEIPYNTIEYLLNKLFINDKESITQFKKDEYTFCYQQKCNRRFYRVSCEIVSPLLINDCLNKNYLGIELQQNLIQERLAFNLDQKENLEYYLKQYLSRYLLN